MDTIEELEQNEVEVYESLESQSGASVASVTEGQSGFIAESSQDFVSKFETEDTKVLSNEQLQRIVLLQKVNVLELQKKKLDLEINNFNPMLIDISALNSSNVSNL